MKAIFVPEEGLRGRVAKNQLFHCIEFFSAGLVSG
jgi:hypothetical protein